MNVRSLGKTGEEVGKLGILWVCVNRDVLQKVVGQ